MSHFSDGNWVDFVNGVLPPPLASELRTHIDRDCADCRMDLYVWQLVRESLPGVEYPVPESLHPKLERLLVSAKPWTRLKEWVRWAVLTFDSLSQPSPVFVRGPKSDSRHLIYEVDPYTIDVTLKSSSTEDSLLILGQVLNATTPDQSTNDVQVVLLSGEELVAKTNSNENGEFELRCEPQQDLRLFINVSGEKAIGLSLKGTD